MFPSGFFARTYFAPAYFPVASIPSVTLARPQTFPLVWLQSAQSASDLGIRVDVFEPAQASNFPLIWLNNDISRRTAVCTDISEVEYGEELGVVTGFRFSMPAVSVMAEYMVHGHEVRISLGGEGLVHRGYIESTEEIFEGDRLMLQVSGPAIARDLVDRRLIGFRRQGAELRPLGEAIISGTGWGIGEFDTTSILLQLDGVGATRWQGLATAAERCRMYLRANLLSKTVDIGAFGTNPRGVTFMNMEDVGPEMDDNPFVRPISSIRIVAESRDVVNRIYPTGQRKGIGGPQQNVGLDDTTRTTPYTPQFEVGDDGFTYGYLQADASVAANRLKEAFVVYTDIFPQGTSETDAVAASNAVYDQCAGQLEKISQRQTAYQVSVGGLKHIVYGSPLFRVGETIRVIYNGIVETIEEGRWARHNIDREMYVLGWARTRRADGTDDWRLTLSTVQRPLPSDGNLVAKLLQDISSVAAAPLPFLLFANAGGSPVAAMTANGLQIVAPSGAQVGFWYLPGIVGGNPADEALYGYDSGSAIEDFAGEPYADKRFGAYSIAGTEESSIIGVASANGFGIPEFLIQGSTTKDGGHTGDLSFAYDSVLQRFVLTIDGERPGGMNKVTGSGYLVHPAAATGIDPANSGSAWTNGAWSEVVASTAQAQSIIGIIYGWDALDNLTRVEAEIDIGTGAAAAEVAVATIPAFKQQINPGSGVSTDSNDFSADQRPVFFPAPIEVASSTRIAVRVRSSDTGREPSDIRLIYAKASELVAR